jgi:hypothetical protein
VSDKAIGTSGEQGLGFRGGNDAIISVHLGERVIKIKGTVGRAARAAGPVQFCSLFEASLP